MSWYRFRAAYVQGQWKRSFAVHLDQDGRILACGDTAGSEAEFIDGYLLPGIPNGHSHSFQFAMAGMSEHGNPQGDDFWMWREQMYKLANSINPDELLTITTQLYMGLLTQGYTSVCEFHYLHHDTDGKAYQKPDLLSEVIMEAAKRSGIQLTLVPIYYQQAAPNKAITERQKRFYSANTDEYLQLLEHVENSARARYPQVIVGYGVHSMRSANARDMKTILGRHWTSGPCHLHASEQTADVQSFEEAYHCRPIDWLYDNVPLDAHHNLVHATHINEGEIKRLVQTRASVVLCPMTEANLGDGIFPLQAFHAQGGNWCVGSDSQVTLNPFLEMQAAELTQRLLLRKRNVLCSDGAQDSGKIIYDQVTRSGRRALGLAAESLAPGQLFEGLVLDPNHERLLDRPLASILGILTFAHDRSMVKDVFSTGKQWVKDGKHIALEANRQDYERCMKSLMQGLSQI